MAYDDERSGRSFVDDASEGYPKYDPSAGAVYSREVETGVGAALTGLWLFGNLHYWNGVFEKVASTHGIIAEDEQLEWMQYRRKARAVWDRNIRDD